MSLSTQNISSPVEDINVPLVSAHEQNTLLGKEAKVFADRFFPEAIGTIEAVRGYGSLQSVEIRVHPDQPGARVRVAFKGAWELIEGGEV
jgi:hypothetical protein